MGAAGRRRNDYIDFGRMYRVNCATNGCDLLTSFYCLIAFWRKKIKCLKNNNIGSFLNGIKDKSRAADDEKAFLCEFRTLTRKVVKFEDAKEITKILKTKL